MLRSSSKSSFSKKSMTQKFSNDSNLVLFKKIQDLLQEASINLPYFQFLNFYENIMKSCMKKYEIQNTQKILIPFLKRLMQKYSFSVQQQVRVMFLQVKLQYKMLPQQSLNILIKIKHMIIDSECEYLLSKVFIMQAKIYKNQNLKELQWKSLRKCVQYTQNFVVQYIQQKQQIRKQISQIIIISYIELYKLKKQSNPTEAEQYLSKAYRTSEKIYGSQSQIKEILSIAYNNHKNVSKSIDVLKKSMKNKKRAITQIIQNQIKKDTKIISFYSWQDQKIIVQMIKEKNLQRRILSEAEFCIKLDMSKINQLKNFQWVEISQGEIVILQDQILKVVQSKQQQTIATRVGIKTISREQIIKKDNLSSSSQDPSFIQKEDFNFIRRLGRAQSAKRQQNN